ncbi:hypothetical protein GCM10010466_12740 [Planomonospora alba]|uniref:Uncharacterized protein n=1 Tax=Planomonospora alba TaxID=161354 RepID=A0ABP6MRA7_9ACTN
MTSGQDVLRRVDVPVVPGAQGQFGEQVPALAACLGRGVPAVDDDQAAAVPLALVLQQAAELTPPAIGDGAGQGPVADHPRDVEVFDRDHVVVADQPRAGLVREIGAGAADLRVGAGDLGLGLGTVVRPALPAGHAALVAGQVPGLALQVARVGDALAVAGDGEVLHAQVYAVRMFPSYRNTA